jgi:hypothetical protein
MRLLRSLVLIGCTLSALVCMGASWLQYLFGNVNNATYNLVWAVLMFLVTIPLRDVLKELEQGKEQE